MYPFALPPSTLFRIGLFAKCVSQAHAHTGEEAGWYKDQVTAAHACIAASKAHGYSFEITHNGRSRLRQSKPLATKG